MLKLVTLLSLVSISLSVHSALASQDIACKSYIVQSQDKSVFKDHKLVIYEGPGFSKEGRPRAYLAENDPGKVSYMVTQGFMGGTYSITTVGAIAEVEAQSVGVLIAETRPNQYPSNLAIASLVIFCGADTAKIEARQAKYLRETQSIVLPFSERK